MPGAQLSDKVRSQIIRWSDEGKQANGIAELAACSVRTVYYILSYHRDYHTTGNPHARTRRRKRVLDMGDVNFLLGLIEAKPKIYLDKLRDQLWQSQSVDVCVATIYRSLRQWEIKNKTVSSSAIERNEHLRATWQAAYDDIPAEYRVWLDEASVDNNTYQRQKAWSTIGQATVC